MSFGKLYDLFASQSIPFIRLDKLGDWHEGRIHKSDKASLYKLFSESEFTKLGKLPDSTLDKIIDIKEEVARKHYFASCWSRVKNESSFHWQQFGGPEGVAIVCDKDDLLDYWIEDRCTAHDIRYEEDFNPDEVRVRLDEPFIYKHPIFQGELETRFLYSTMPLVLDEHAEESRDADDFPDTYLLKFDTKILIKKIVISPFAQPYIASSVMKLALEWSMDPSQIVRSEYTDPQSIAERYYLGSRNRLIKKNRRGNK